MAAMVKRTALSLGVLLILAVAASSAACGGGSPATGSKAGQPITDPARVPSSTPIGTGGVLYQIRADGRVDASGGATTTVVAGATTLAANSKTYTVASGDTCGAIDAKFGITLDELKRSNRLIDDSCSNLHAGDVLKIPGAAAATTTAAAGTTPGPTAKPGASGGTYVVASGDTCDGIAKAKGVTVAALIAANGIDANCQGLKIGQTIKIP
jgi:LysM repeat protein